jgi:hypothetical protein
MNTDKHCQMPKAQPREMCGGFGSLVQTDFPFQSPIRPPRTRRPSGARLQPGPVHRSLLARALERDCQRTVPRIACDGQATFAGSFAGRCERDGYLALVTRVERTDARAWRYRKVPTRQNPKNRDRVIVLPVLDIA